MANGDARPDHPRLILPELLSKAAIDIRLEAQDEARRHAIVRRWAELESSGKLVRMNETTLEGEFLTQIFGDVLGYVLFSENLPQWQLWPHFGTSGGQADAAIGRFRQGAAEPPRAVIELKGPRVNVDRDRFQGRTPVRQCFDYLTDLPGCPWGIVCNYVSFRLYHRGKTTRVFEDFKLQDLRRIEEFRKFRLVFGRDGLLPLTSGQRPLMEHLLDESESRQRQVGDSLYTYYRDERRELIAHLMRPPHGKPLDAAIRIAQKLIDRIIFVAFCEDRLLLPEKSIERAWSEVSTFRRVTNPRWEAFLALFDYVDKGRPELGFPPFNGGLFAEDPEINELRLEDTRTDFFKGIGEYDFSQKVNVEVLGHLFEKSINDLERLRTSGLFGEKAPVAAATPRMAKSAERKRGGIYYTPKEFTGLIVRRTVAETIEARLDEVARCRGVNRRQAERADKPDPRLAEFWKDCFEAVRRIKVCDPACGSGAFLIRAYEVFEDCYRDLVGHRRFHQDTDADAADEAAPGIILRDNLYGVDLSPQAVEITQLALWIRSARRGKSLADLSQNVVWGNSLVADPAVHPQAMDWREKFRDVFVREEGGFDCVIGNPPWERLKLQEREFFDAAAPDIAAAVSAATRRRLIAELENADPELHARYVQAKEAAEKTLDHVRTSGRFPLTAVGDVNTYAVFAELARTILAPRGRAGLLLPSGIATDLTTKDFFAALVDAKALVALYDFENKAPIFPDVHRSYKFCVLLFGGAAVKAESADFVFFAHRIEDLGDKDRRIELAPEDLKLLNPNSHTCPIFRSRRDAELTKAIYRRVPILVDRRRKKGGDPWGIRFVRMFDQTNDAELFHTAEDLHKKGFKRDGACWKKGKHKFLPLYEAKMIQAYDHRAASVVVDQKNWMRQGQTLQGTSVQHQNPEHVAVPRFWVQEDAVVKLLGGTSGPTCLCYKDVTSSTNQRTMIAAFVPLAGVMNSAPIVLVGDSIAPTLHCCLLANLNSLAYDYVARQKVGGLHLNFFIVEQLPTLPPDAYAKRCPWDKRQTLEKWVSDRVLKLTCTANDMIPLAKAAGLEPPVHKWREDERAELLADLDAAYFLLYGLEREDAAYILSTFQGAGGPEPGLIDALSPAERVLRAYDRLREASRSRAR